MIKAFFANNFRVFTVIFLIFFSFLNFYWVRLDVAPPQWDQSHYLEGSEYVYQSLTKGGILEFLNATTVVLPRRAPLIAILPTPLYLIFGNSPDTALLINFICLPIFYIFLYLLIRKFFDENISLLSLIVVSTFPLFYGLLRQFFVEFLLMTTIVVWLYASLKTENFTNKKAVFWFGVVSGVAMMIKFHFFLYIAGPFIYLLYKNLKSKQPIIKCPINILIALIPFLVITIPWYSKNILVVLWHAKRFTNPENLGNYYYGPPLSMANIYLSLYDFINYVISSYFFLLIIFLIAGLFIYKHRLKHNFFLASWFIIPFLVFFFGPNKDYRFMLPILPPLAIFISTLLLKTHKLNYLQIFIILLIPVMLFLNSVFNFSQRNITIGPFVFFSNTIGAYIYPPEKTNWPLAEILKSLTQLEPRDRTKTIVLGSEYKYFNVNNLIYTAKRDNIDMKVISSSYFRPTTPLSEVHNEIFKGDYLLVRVDKDLGPTDTNRFHNQIVELARSWDTRSYRVFLPDGSDLFIKRIPK